MRKADLVLFGIMGDTFESMVLSAVIFRTSGSEDGGEYDSPLGNEIGERSADEVFCRERRSIWMYAMEKHDGETRRTLPAVVVYNMSPDLEVRIEYVEWIMNTEVDLILIHLGFAPE